MLGRNPKDWWTCPSDANHLSMHTFKKRRVWLFKRYQNHSIPLHQGSQTQIAPRATLGLIK